MTTSDVLSVWHKYFDGFDVALALPETWVIRMWVRRYKLSHLEHAARITRHGWRNGRLHFDSAGQITRYLTGVMRNSVAEDAEVGRDNAAYDSSIGEQMR